MEHFTFNAPMDDAGAPLQFTLFDLSTCIQVEDQPPPRPPPPLTK